MLETVRKNLDELDLLYDSVGLKRDNNTRMILSTIEQLEKRVAELEKRTA